MRISVTLAVASVFVTGTCFVGQGPVTGDVAVTRALQSLFCNAPLWAEWLTDTAKPPIVVATMVIGAGLAWLAAGWRAAFAVPLAFGLGWLLDKALRAAIFAPRPSADLVAVASASSSSGLPSTFGLVYGSIFGVVVFAGASGTAALGVRAFACALIITGAAARVVLGGHWTSQMLASVLLGLLAATVAHELIVRVFLKERAR